MAGTYSRDGRDYYTGPDGQLVSVEAGFDPSTNYPGLTPATEDDVKARDYEKQNAKANVTVDPAFNRDASGDLNPDAAFGTTEKAPLDKIREFVALKPAAPAAPKPFSRDGRDYYVDPGGKLHSVEAGFDATTEFPGLKPATAEQVRKRDIQKRSGHLIDQVETIGHTAAATALEAGTGLYNFAHDSTVGFYGPDSHVTGKDVAPGLYGDKELEQREANPTAAFIGAAVPDLAANFLIPGAAGEGTVIRGLTVIGPETTAAKILASGIVTEAGNDVIEGDEFDMGRVFTVWAPTQLVFEGAGNVALQGVARGLGWTKNAVDNMVERAQRSAVQDALRETDPARQSAKLLKNAEPIYQQAQTQLDEALSVIDERAAAAPEKLFTRGALKKTVSNNLNAQADDVLDIATNLAHAAEVSGDETAQKAAELLDNVRGSSGHVLYDALRQARRLFDDAAGALDNPLVKEQFERLETSLADENVWGRAARNYTNTVAEAARAAGPVEVRSVKDLAAREAIDRRLEQARAMASLTGDKKLGAAVERASAALKDADKVTGARVMSAGATTDEIKAFRQQLDAFPERAPKLASTISEAVDELEAISPEMLPDTWTAERVESHIAARAAGSKAARAELEQALDHAEEWLKAAKRGGTEEASTIARGERQLGKIRDALDEVDEIPKAFRTVRDFDARPRNLAEKAIDTVVGKTATKVISKLASAAGGAAAGYAGGGPVGAAIGGVAGNALEGYVEPIIRARATKFGQWLKEALRKHGKTAAGVAALYGANKLANADDASPNAAATVAMLGVPLFLHQGKPTGLLEGMRELDKRLAPLRGRDGFVYWDQREPILKELFGSHDSKAARLVDDMLDKLKQRERFTGEKFDLYAPSAEKTIERELRAHTFGGIDEKFADAKKAFTVEKAARTRGNRAGAKSANARELFGEYAAKIDRNKADLKKRVQSPEPLTMRSFMLNDLGFSSSSLPEHLTTEEHYRRRYDPGHPQADRYGGITEYESPERLAWLQEREKGYGDAVPGLRDKVKAALAGVDPKDKIARITIEDQVIRESLREALGMRPQAVKRAKDMATDATSRYRKAKPGFDKWREEALDKQEFKASRTWQTMRYRAINADTRVGSVGRELTESLDSEAAALVANGNGLWATEQAENAADIKNVRTIAANLQSALNKAVDAGWAVPGRVTRGIAMPPDEVERLLKAKTVTAQGFMSTSIHSGTPKGFAERRAKEFGEVPVMLTIEQRTGVPFGQGEGELTLRPGTKFDVVWAQPANDDGLVTAYLREAEPSRFSPVDVLKGLAGKVPTEAKVAGGLLALGGAAAADDDNDSGAAAAGVGGLYLIFGGGNASKLFVQNTKRAMLGIAADLGPMGRHIDDALKTSGFLKQAVDVAAYGETHGKAEFLGALDSLKADVNDRLAFYLEKTHGPLSEDMRSNVDRYANAWVDSTVAEWAGSKPDAILDEDTVMGRRLWGARGSNEGGAYQGTDGVKRYVKFYEEPQQAIGEHMANEIYRQAGIPAPRSALFEGNGGNMGYSSELIRDADSKPFGDYSVSDAKEVARGFWSDVLLANWDAMGTHFDNIVWDKNGRPYRIDNGSALKYRAQGKPKPLEALESLSEIEGFFDPKKNRSYARLLEKAGYTEPKQLSAYLPDTLQGAAHYLENPGPNADPDLIDILQHRLELLQQYSDRLEGQSKRRLLRLGDGVVKQPMPESLGHNDNVFVTNHILNELRDAPGVFRARDMKTLGEQRNYINRLDDTLKERIAERFPDPTATRKAVEKFTAEQVQIFKSNTEAKFELPEPDYSYTEIFETDPLQEQLRAHIDRAEKALTPKEVDAIQRFTGEASEDMKQIMTGEIENSTVNMFASSHFSTLKEAVPHLESAAQKLIVPNPTKDGPLFRGVNVPDAALHELLTLDRYSPRSTLSASHEERSARTFTNGSHRKVMLRFMHVEQAAPVLHLSRMPSENEWFIPRGGAFEVKGRYYSPLDDMFVFDLAQVDSASKPDITSAGALAVLLGLGAAAAANDNARAGVTEGAKSLFLSEREEADDQDREQALEVIRNAKVEASAKDEARQQQLDETRDKLGFISHQGQTLMRTAARAIASPGGADDRTVERVPGVTSSAGVARFLGSQSTLGEAFEDKRRLLNNIARDPMAMVHELADSYSELQDTAPALHSQLVAQTFKVAQFLQSKLPPTVGATPMRPEGSPPNALELRQFALYYSAATDPSSVLTDVANNRARKEQVDTLKAVWPETYQSLKVAVIEQIAERRPTVSQRARLDLLFDFGQNFDRAFSPGLVAVLDGYRAKDQKGGPDAPGGGAPPKTPGRSTQPSVRAAGALPALALGPASGPGTLA